MNEEAATARKALPDGLAVVLAPNFKRCLLGRFFL
jgi:hypothetical protein